MSAFARDQIRYALQKRADALSRGYRQNVGIIGAMGLGKTHILNDAIKDFARRPGYTCIFIQAEACDYEQLAERWMGSVLAGYIYSEGQSVPEGGLDALFAHCSSLIPKTLHQINLIRKTLRREKGPSFMKELFSLPRILSEETGKKIILMIDEFQELEKMPAPDPFALLGQEIMVEKDTMYIVSSSKPERAREIFRDKLSLLFGNFEVIELRPFDFQETADFLSFHFPHTRFSREQLKFFITLTNGEPLYLDLLLDRLKLYLSSNGDNILSDSLMFLTFQEELFDRKGRLSLHFEKVLQPILRGGKEETPYLRTLLAVSEGNHRIAQIAAYIGRKAAETRKILSRLIMEDLISKQGGLYLIQDSLFRFWLKEVFDKRNQLFWPSSKIVEENLHVALRETLEKICHEEKKSLASQIHRLLKEFRNDIVEIEGKKTVCPLFTEVVSERSTGGHHMIWAKTQKARWVIYVCDEKAQEEDVLAFQEDIKKSGRNVQRKVLVLPAGIDQNAKLMAQNFKMQMWGLRDCNTLLELNNLPKMILLHESNTPHSSELEPALAVAQSVLG